MTANAIFWTMAAVGLGTFLMRASFISVFTQRNMPAVVERIMAYLPVAILSALIVPAFVIRDGAAHVGLDNYRLLAGLLAIGVAAKTKKVVPTLFVGLVCLWVLQRFQPFGG
ncbi:AzlD domain-containing protein [Acanthopleuribacter pedis]|uniref:AzlD domain-containing protein n=1 Tax=Acanthopleuribacter pedis TaxID=442870 RepID=A0A8J7QFW7_9BACT|nr:AzlD domain-containing protein [Acanthopleuribacter pedis]MBO1317740.1 AzlD domain-containing protein [Acanthopleuribacter pedis]